MSRRRKPRRSRGQKFLLLHFWELESPAFLALSADAVRVYLDMRKRLDFDCGNNGQVPYSHRDAAKVLHADWRRASNALAELVHYGFMKLRNGGEPGAHIRLACEWQLTAFECGGQDASKSFLRWSGEAFERPYRSRATRPEKQLPIGNLPTRRRQHADAAPVTEDDSDPKNGQSVGNMQTLLPAGRRQHADTLTVTTLACPIENESMPARSALPSAAPDGEKCPWRKPSYVEVDFSSYPQRRKFGPWLGDARNRLGIQVRELADAIGLLAGDLFELETGRTKVGRIMQAQYVAGLRGILEDGASSLRRAS